MIATADVLVIGGGPAGAAAASRLAAGGLRVVLCERDARPRHQVCGEFVSEVAAAELAELGLTLQSLGARRIGRTRIFAADVPVTARLPFAAYGLSREHLDCALRAIAAGHGAEVREGAHVRALGRAGGVWSAVLGRSERIESGAVILATGKHDLRGHTRAPDAASPMIGLKMHCRLCPEQAEALGDAVELFLYDGGYAGLQAVEGGRVNLCFVVRPQDLRAGRDAWTSTLVRLGKLAPALQARLTGARPLWARPAGIAHVPYGYVCPPHGVPEALYRVGDQAAVIPSLAGEGIAIALRTGRLAADAVLSGRRSDRYVAALRRDVTGAVRRARMIEAAMCRFPGRGIGFMAAVPGLLPGLARLTRISRPAAPRPAAS